MANKKISQLDPYSGPNNPVGYIPITILGVTLKITPQQLFSLSANVLAALQGANSPSGANPFATMNDVPDSADFIPLTGTSMGNPVTGNIEFNGAGVVVFGSDVVVGNATDSTTISPSNFFQSGLGYANFINATLGLSLSDGFEGANLLFDKLRFEDFMLGFTQDIIPNPTPTANIAFQPPTGVPAGTYTLAVTVQNSTGVALSDTDLSAAYPDAQDGFQVVCKNILKKYLKSDGQWFSVDLTLVT